MNENQKLLLSLKEELLKQEEDDIILYYGDPLLVWNDIESYLDKIPSLFDKIAFAQWSNSLEKTKELCLKLSLSKEEQEVYDLLKDKNIELDETLNFNMLNKKYSFLSNRLDLFTTDVDIQDYIISLNDDSLNLFKILYEYLDKTVDYPIPQIQRILKCLGYSTNPYDAPYNKTYHVYDKLNSDIFEYLKNGNTLTEEQIETLLYIYTSRTNFELSSLADLNNFQEIAKKEIDEIIDSLRNKTNPTTSDLDEAKYALLLRTYGIGEKYAKTLIKTYDLTSLKPTEENKDLFEMYKVILEILNISDLETIISIYDNFKKELNPNLNYMRAITFENALRKEFARTLNNEVFSPKNNSFSDIDGVRIYDAGVDFKMIVTALGSYQGKTFKNQENYSDYWNNKKIRSHGNCCSLIANNNLSMAKVRNVIFGFSTMDENMLLMCGDKDLNSTPNSRFFSPVDKTEKNTFVSPDDLIDKTRGDYNELVYERRDLSSNPKFFKKNPDYIVFIEGYEDIDKYIEYYRQVGKQDKVDYLLKQKEIEAMRLQESIKAAKDFHIPIVKINRETCAKNESRKLEELVLKFEETKDPELIYRIITDYQNNRFGNKNGYPLIQAKYFGKVKMDKYLERIDNAILSIDDTEVRTNTIKRYREIITLEQSKVEYYRYISNTKKNSAIDFERTLGIIDGLEDFSKKGIK